MAALSTPQGRAAKRPLIPRLSRDWSLAVFAALLVIGGVLVLVETRGLSFFGDEWDFLVQRRGLSPHTLLRPHGPHLSLIPILVYKVMLAIFGGSSYLPFRVLAALDLVLIAGVLGIVCRSFWGPWFGLVPVLLLVTLGPGGSSILWPFQVGYALAVASGVLALVAAGYQTRRGDLLSCVALLVSLGSASQGVGFTAGVLVIVILSRGSWLRRLWVPAVPAILYGMWYIGYGRQASESHLALWHTSFHYALDGLSATLAALAGLSSVSAQTGLLDASYGVPLALAAAGAVAFAGWRGWRPPALFTAAAATLIVLWVAASLSNTPTFYRPAEDPRYLSSNAVLVLLCACAAVPRPRLPRGGILAGTLLLVIIAATNAWDFSSTRQYEGAATATSRAELGALQIMRGSAPAAFSPTTPGDPAALVGVNEANFSAGVRDFGLTGDSPSTLRSLEEGVRERVDHELASGEGISLTPVPSATTRCSEPVTAGPLTAGGYALLADRHARAAVTLRRFGSTATVGLGTIAAGAAGVFHIPADRNPEVPWRITIDGTNARLCQLIG